MTINQSRNCVSCNTHPLCCDLCGMEQPDDEPEWEQRAEKYRLAFLSEEERADALGRQVDDLRAANEYLRAALLKIADLVDSEADEPLDDAIRIARDALSDA
jgi:hypothetical protein